MRSFPRFVRCALLAATALVCCVAMPALGQDWPTKPIRVVSPYAAGGVGDTLFRIIAPQLETRLGQRFVIDNRPGANGHIGIQETIRSAPDGYTVVMAPTANFAVNQHLFRDLPFDAIAQLDPIATVADAPLVAIVTPPTPARTLQELADYARANPGKLNYGSPGTGSPAHLAGAFFSQLTGNALVYVPYKGTPPMIQALLANDIQAIFPTLPGVVALVKAGKLRALAVMAKERLAEIPEVPSAVEAGFGELVSGNWWVLAAPRGTDPRIVNRFAAEIRTALADPGVVKRFAEIGHVPVGHGPAESAAFIRAESARWRQIVERGGIKPE